MSSWMTISSSTEKNLKAGDPVRNGHLPCLKAFLKSYFNEYFCSGYVVMNLEFFYKDSTF